MILKFNRKNSCGCRRTCLCKNFIELSAAAFAIMVTDEKLRHDAGNNTDVAAVNRNKQQEKAL